MSRRFKKKKKSIFKTILKVFFLLMFVAIAGGVGYGYYFFNSVEPIDPSSIYSSLDKSSYIYNGNGELIDTVFYTENRKIVSAKDFPEHLENAFIAIEDKTFYKHHGINLKRIIGAVWNSVRNKEDISGTSTITQQLARNVFLADIKSQRSIKRKATEIVYSFELEKALSKEEIIEAYLNTVYFGYGCYGISSAADTYFSKDPSELNLEECALLASLPQSPDVYALIKTEEGENTVSIGHGLYANKIAEPRRDLVLDLMCEQGYITQEQANAAKKPVEDVLNPDITSRNYDYTYFKSFLIEQLRKDLANELSITEEEAEKKIYTGGLKIYSTIDPDAQHAVLNEFQNNANFPGTVKSGVTPEAAMVIIENGTGYIKALVGGRDGHGDNLFNRATSPRQPGSSIKPLAVYGPALQKSYEYAQNGSKFPFVNYRVDSQGVSGWGDYITVNSIVKDEKMTMNGQQWPNNITRRFSGKQSFRTALQNSINTCSVKILLQVGYDYSADMLKKFGISTIVTDTTEAYNDVNPAALGLGAMTVGTTPLEMAVAYSVFPNGGEKVEPTAYTKVEDSEGNVILDNERVTSRVMDEGVAWIMTDLLKSVVSNGIARSAAIRGTSVGGKTGTTDDKYDFWFCGFTPKYSAALWVGTDKNVQMYASSDVAASLWSKIMRQVPEVTSGEYRDMPYNVVQQGGEYYSNGTQPLSPNSFGRERKESSSSSNIYEDDDPYSSRRRSSSDMKPSGRNVYD